jgi:hypothetical protein
MKSFTVLLLAAICAGSMLTGCAGKDGEPGPTGATGPAGQILTGNLFGFVNPVDEFGNPVSKSGVTVTLDGVTPATTVTSDVNGRFEFVKLPSGTYNLTYTRADLGSYRRIGVGHVGGDQPTFAFTSTVSQPSSTRILNPFVSSPSNGLVTVQFGFANNGAPTGNFNRYVLYVGSNASVTSTTGMWYANTVYGTSSSTGAVTFTRAALNALGFASNSTAYVVVYAAPNTFSSYIDPTTGRTIATGLGVASTVIPFMVP